jgi:hypothetical protein
VAPKEAAVCGLAPYWWSCCGLNIREEELFKKNVREEERKGMECGWGRGKHCGGEKGWIGVLWKIEEQRIRGILLLYYSSSLVEHSGGT